MRCFTERYAVIAGHYAVLGRPPFYAYRSRAATKLATIVMAICMAFARPRSYQLFLWTSNIDAICWGS